MTELTVIILVGNEERHIGRCLDRLAALEPRQVFVVESQTGDRTHDIAAAKGATTVFHAWPGTQAEQFNWALDHLPIAGAWVLRLDADEYVAEGSVERLKRFLQEGEPAAAGARLELRRVFMGGEIRHGTSGIRQVRLFRRGKARYPEGEMDERLAVEGETVDLDVAFYDHSLMPLAEWQAKHRGYAKREAAQARASLASGVWTDPRKAAYYRLPRYVRVLVYWAYRYLLRGGFLDGRAGWRWHFWQGLWYRWTVDREFAKPGGGR